MHSLPPYLTVAEVAARLSLSEETITAAIKSGALPASNVSQGKLRPRWRVSESDLAQWLESRQAVPVKRHQRRRRTLTIPQYV